MIIKTCSDIISFNCTQIDFLLLELCMSDFYLIEHMWFLLKWAWVIFIKLSMCDFYLIEHMWYDMTWHVMKHSAVESLVLWYMFHSILFLFFYQFGMTPLMCAAIQGDVNTMRALVLEYNADINAQNNVSNRMCMRMCCLSFTSFLLY